MLYHTSFIDSSIPSTHVLIEQKSVDKDLRKSIKQADGSVLTPFQHAKRYLDDLPYSMWPRWIVTCNLQEFLVYDMGKPSGEPESILLINLEKESHRLNFLVDTRDENIRKEMEVSILVGSLVGVFYDALLHQYRSPHLRNVLCPKAQRGVPTVMFFSRHAGLMKNLWPGAHAPGLCSCVRSRDANPARLRQAGMGNRTDHLAGARNPFARRRVRGG